MATQLIYYTLLVCASLLHAAATSSDKEKKHTITPVSSDAYYFLCADIIYAAVNAEHKMPGPISLFTCVTSEKKETPVAHISQNMANLIYHADMQPPLTLESIEGMANCLANMWHHRLEKTYVSFTLCMLLMDTTDIYRIDYTHERTNKKLNKHLQCSHVINIANVPAYLSVIGGFNQPLEKEPSTCSITNNIQEIATELWQKKHEAEKLDTHGVLALLDVAKLQCSLSKLTY